MNKTSSGKRQPLLMVRRSIDRLLVAMLLFGLLLFAIWMVPLLAGVGFISKAIQSVISVSAVVLVTLSLFAFLARFRAFVQVRPSYLSIVSPLLQLNISFQRLRSAHPALIQQLFPPKESSWAQRAYLHPFYGKTAVVLELNEYPISKFILRLFLTGEMFSPHNSGFVLLVPDWMTFSTELDTFHGRWLGGKNGKGKLSGSTG